MKQPATLVFDIGKTAKKVLVFDSLFHVADEIVEHFSEIPDEDGFLSENLSLLSKWVKDKLIYYLAHPDYEITHINFSAYGASLVHLDSNDEPLPSFYNYLKPFPEARKAEFWEKYNGDTKIPESTSSPWLGMLNSGLQLFWMKREKNEAFKKVKTSLHFPQYFPFLVSGNKFCEITSIGCHTMLWDFQQKDYHSWVKSEGLLPLFPPVMLSDHTVTLNRYGKQITLGVGVHDSSAALMPYLVTQREPFLLLSTGTWNITFNPFNDEPLTQQELEKDCLCYLTFEGKPVKASRIFLGHEYEMQILEIVRAFKPHTEFHSRIKFDEAIYKKLEADQDPEKVIHPVGMEGSGPLPEKQHQRTNWKSFESVEEAYHQLVRYLVKWQLLSIDLVNPDRRIKNIIVVGGFTRNLVFLDILKREATHQKIFLSDHPRAAALGAAWLVCGKESYKEKEFLLSISEH